MKWGPGSGGGGSTDSCWVGGCVYKNTMGLPNNLLRTTFYLPYSDRAFLDLLRPGGGIPLSPP